MELVDVVYLTEENIKNSVLSFHCRLKGQIKKVLLGSSALNILNKYACKSGVYLFPLLDRFHGILFSTAQNYVAKNMKEIGQIIGFPKLTFGMNILAFNSLISGVNISELLLKHDSTFAESNSKWNICDAFVRPKFLTKSTERLHHEVAPPAILRLVNYYNVSVNSSVCINICLLCKVKKDDSWAYLWLSLSFPLGSQRFPTNKILICYPFAIYYQFFDVNMVIASIIFYFLIFKGRKSACYSVAGSHQKVLQAVRSLLFFPFH